MSCAQTFVSYLNDPHSQTMMKLTGDTDHDKDGSLKTMMNVQDLIGYVEVRWGNRTEPVCFVLPEDHKELQDSTKGS